MINLTLILETFIICVTVLLCIYYICITDKDVREKTILLDEYIDRELNQSIKIDDLFYENCELKIKLKEKKDK